MRDFRMDKRKWKLPLTVAFSKTPFSRGSNERGSNHLSANGHQADPLTPRGVPRPLSASARSTPTSSMTASFDSCLGGVLGRETLVTGWEIALP